MWYDRGMEKRKNNSTKNKNVTKKAAKSVALSQKTVKNSNKFDTVVGILNVVACLAAGGVMGWYWQLKIDAWEVLVGILALALVVWLNMIHVSETKDEKRTLGDMKMAIFGGAKVVFYWVIIHTVMMMASMFVHRLPLPLYMAGVSGLQILELVLFVTVTLMHFVMMRDLKMKWGVKLYIWMFIWSLAAMLFSGVTTFCTSVDVLFSAKLGFVLYLAQMSVFVTLFAVVIGEVYKKFIDRKK